MKYVWITLTVLAAIVALVALVGAFLPVAHAAARRVTLRAPRSAVFATIAGVDGYVQWHPGVKKVEWLPEANGTKRFREVGPHGPMDLAIERSEPDRLFVTRIVTEGSPFGGTWTFRMDERDGATTVTLTENGEVYNVIFRCLARFVFGHTATIEACLRALAAKHGAADATVEATEPDAPPR